MNTPRDILDYIVESGNEYDFLASMMMHVGGYSIAEIAGGEFKKIAGGYRFVAENYNINTQIDDDDIITAIINGLYISSFISRHNEIYQVHFMVHQYPISMKSRFEDEIVKAVVQYMIMKTIIALRLDTYKKVDDYIKKIYNQ